MDKNILIYAEYFLNRLALLIHFFNHNSDLDSVD